MPCSARFVSCGITTRAKGIIQVYELSHGTVECVLGARTAASSAERSATRLRQPDRRARRLRRAQHLGPRAHGRPLLAQAHSSIVNATDGIGGLGIGGGRPSRDGLARRLRARLDPRVLSPSSRSSRPRQAVRDCWTVAFGNSFGDDDVAVGYGHGDLKIFDLCANAMRETTRQRHHIGAVRPEGRRNEQMRRDDSSRASASLTCARSTPRRASPP